MRRSLAKGNSCQPGSELRLAPKLIELSPGQKTGVLQNILSVNRATHPVHEHRVQTTLISLNQSPERGGIARPRSSELGVFIR